MNHERHRTGARRWRAGHGAAAALGLAVAAALLYALFAVADAHMRAAAQTSHSARWHAVLALPAPPAPPVRQGPLPLAHAKERGPAVRTPRAGPGVGA